jgi:capsular polysaccharide biosynthesis protein
MDLSRNSSKKIEMSPRRNSKIIEINSRKNSRKDSKNVKITSSISFKKSPSFKKPMTAHQVSDDDDDDDGVWLSKITTWQWVIKSTICIFQRKNTQTQPTLSN